MKVTVIADATTSSGRAAAELLGVIEAAWPWVQDDPDTDLRIVGGFKGYRPQCRDIDIVLLGRFGARAVVAAPAGLKNLHNGDVDAGEPLAVMSLCLTIEVKDPPREKWRLRGDILEVEYDGAWTSATEQSHEQQVTLRDYFERHGLRPPRVANLIWLRTAAKADLGETPQDSILTGDLGWTEMLGLVFRHILPVPTGGRHVVNAVGRNLASDFPPLADSLTKIARGTHLDMRQMNRIAGDLMNPSWLAAIGRRQLRLRGRAGTGKTIMLLHLARHLVAARDASVLVLTFNRVLATNLHRLLILLEAEQPGFLGSVRVLTCDRYLMALFRATGLWDNPGVQGDFNARKAACEDELLRRLDTVRGNGADPRSLLTQLDRQDAWLLEHDHLFVDEGQDIPVKTFRILRAFFPATRTVVADGIDQRVRGGRRCSWEGDLEEGGYEVVQLERCLRMKPNLARFCNLVASHLGLKWEVTPNGGQDGGRVILVDGNYFASRDLHDDVCAANRHAGNQPLDMLLCVPSSRVRKGAGHNYLGAADAPLLSKWGHPVWDGTDERLRDTVPQSPEMLRIVPYTSCRGLEGWVCILLDLDQFYDRQVEKAQLQAGEAEKETGLAPDPQALHLDAAYWMMMPLTRAIDTLVITLSGHRNRFQKALEAAARECEDFVERKYGC